MFLTLLIIHSAATCMMTGLIWFVQVVHYPLFSRVGKDEFVSYELAHQRYTSFVVGPLMFVEGVTAITFLFWRDDTIGIYWPIVGLLLLGLIHASTVFLQVPRHRELSSNFDAVAAASLVRSNWLRTVGWSARSILALVMVAQAA